MTGAADDDEDRSLLFTYVTPFLGVLLVAIGIGAAVPGGYAALEGSVFTCGDPTISVETPEETQQRFGESKPKLPSLQFEQLAPNEQEAFTEAIDAPRREAHIEGPSENAPTLANGTLVVYQGEEYYVTTVSENNCFEAAPLQFPLGVFAIALGGLMILMPPIYEKLVDLEQRAR